MPSGTHTKELDLSIDKIWDFVSDMNKWAPLVPGYIEHEILNEKQSTWTFTGDIGIMQKTIKLQIDITEWNEPTLVSFKLKGLNENFTGNGYFKATLLSNDQTNIEGHLGITAKGVMGPMINQILKSFVPKMAKDFTDSVTNKIEEIEAVTK